MHEEHAVATQTSAQADDVGARVANFDCLKPYTMRSAVVMFGRGPFKQPWERVDLEFEAKHTILAELVEIVVDNIE